MRHSSPANANTDPAASARVRAMFDRVARRYDLLNRILSAGIDRRWRRAAVDAMCIGSGDPALDVATGTGDLAIEMASRGARAAGVDFSRPMLRIARRKLARRRADVALVLGAAESLPFGDERFTAAAIAFGIRNVPDRECALAEMRRVVIPGGRVVVLELALPRSRLGRAVYHPYFRWGLPLGGAILSSAFAYRYLRDSVAAFPERDAFVATMARAGLRDVAYRDLSGGLAVLYSGVR